VNFSATFTDVGDASAHAQAWAVTDAGGNVVASGAGSSLAWTPAAAGAYTVTCTVTDGGGLGASSTLAITVTPVVTPPADGGATLVGGLLTVTGTAAADVINVARNAAGDYVVSIGAGAAQTFPFAGVVAIRIDCGDGEDLVSIATGVHAPAEIHGGDGRDTLVAGGGDDLLFGDGGNDSLVSRGGNDVAVGGSGNDLLYGGTGRDVLIGGAGSDVIAGESGDDILVGGATTHDADPAALAAIRAVWGGGGSYLARVDALRGALLRPADFIPDAGATDLLWGQQGSDWYVADLDQGDRVLMPDGKEIVTNPA
jgi:Ca2+-binding RTX toxin-like protein